MLPLQERLIGTENYLLMSFPDIERIKDLNSGKQIFHKSGYFQFLNKIEGKPN